MAGLQCGSEINGFVSLDGKGFAVIWAVPLEDSGVSSLCGGTQMDGAAFP